MPPRRTLSWIDQKLTHYNETRSFLEAVKVEIVSGLDSVPFGGLLEKQPELMWEHSGRCPCGKLCFLYGQCSKCMREEILNQQKEAGSYEDFRVTDERNEKREHPESLQEFGTRLEPYDVSAGIQVPPKSSLRPLARTGPITQHVHFVTANVVRNLMNSQTLGKGADVQVQEWKPTESFNIPKKPKPPQLLGDMPYRICFVVECTGEVLTLQQCVDAKLETNHRVPKEN